MGVTEDALNVALLEHHVVCHHTHRLPLCVCVCVCVCVCAYAHTRTHARTLSLSLSLSLSLTHTHARTHARTQTRTRARARTHTHTHAHTHTLRDLKTSSLYLVFRKISFTSTDISVTGACACDNHFNHFMLSRQFHGISMLSCYYDKHACMVSQCLHGVTTISWCHDAFMVSQCFHGITMISWYHDAFMVSRYHESRDTMSHVIPCVTKISWHHDDATVSHDQFKNIYSMTVLQGPCYYNIVSEQDDRNTGTTLL